MTQFPDHPFWDFSLDVYMRKGVGEACLELQEKYQLDVNIMLFCLWFGASGRGVFRDGELAALLDAASKWHHDIVRRLRGIRTTMKGGVPPVPDALCESLRQRIQKIEIDCEHAEQLLLTNSVTREPDMDRLLPDRAADATANLGQYLGTFDDALTDRDRSNVGWLLSAGLPDSAGNIEELCAAL